jgi:hypothetical protein
MPGRISINPTCACDDKASPDDKWNLPVGLTAVRSMKLGLLPVRFHFGVEKSVVRQDDFGRDWRIKLNIMPVIPALVNNPIFGG